MRQHIAFVTGTLAEPALREVVGRLEAEFDIEAHVVVLNIQVAALMTADWVGRKLELPAGVAFDRVIVTGYLRGDVEALRERLGVAVEQGPRDVQDLPAMFGGEAMRPDYGAFDIEIIAEINHAASLSIKTIVKMAKRLVSDGADVIDIGCDPSPGMMDREPWADLGDVVRALRDEGLCVSIDTMHPAEIAAGVDAGAELVLSVNSSNRQAACRRSAVVDGSAAEFVAIPDDPRTLVGLDDTIAYLQRHGVSYRIDPIVEPIGCGFAASLERYIDVRRRYPDAAMMMGVGNLSEMTQVDSAGVNMLLIGFCQELGIRSVLTTQVINYARSSVREIDVARRLAFAAVKHHRPPKHLDPRLVILRDERVHEFGDAAMAELASKLTDRNYRIFADGGKIHCMNKDVHVSGSDPFDLLDQLPEELPGAHAFYLGYEMAKAATAITLGKRYVQDEALDWGMLTQPEISHHERRKQGG
jgi:dihydropteroate synthase-like protein